jgi:hypothetical protein
VIDAVGGGAYSRRKMRIAIAVFDGAEEFDFAGPWDALAAWRFLYPNDVPPSAYAAAAPLVTVGASSRPSPERLPSLASQRAYVRA